MGSRLGVAVGGIRREEEGAVIDAVLRWIDRTPDGERLTGGIVAGLYRAAPKVTLMLFDERGDPAVVAKVARAQVAEPALRAEHQALLRFGPGGGYGSFAPAALKLGHVAGRLVLAERALRGRPMTVSYYEPGHVSSRRRVETDFATAGVWLDEFARATAGRTVPFDSSHIAEHVAAPVARYRREIGWSDEEDALFTHALAVADELRGLPLPLGAIHGDFWMGNLLLKGDRVSGVVDWELAREDVPPFRDVYKFPTSYAFYLDRGMGVRGRVPEHRLYRDGARIASPYTAWANAAGFVYAFLTEGWFSSLVRTWVTERLNVRGVVPAFNAVFFPVFLAEQATTLDDKTIREGYRGLVRLLGSGRRVSWLLPNQTGASVPAQRGARSI